MRLIVSLWNKLDITTRLSIGCIALYLSLYVLIGILEVLTGVAIG